MNTQPFRITDHLPRALTIVAFGYAVTLAMVSPKWTVDDAYITFRYARNLALHGELNWNVGCEPVEGYTGIAWPLALAAAIGLGIDPQPASQALGVAGWLACALLAGRVLRELGASTAVGAACMILVLLTPMMLVHALSGLETCAFSAAAVGCLWALLRAMNRWHGRSGCTAVFLSALLVGLIRPEGALAGPAVLLIGWVHLRGAHPRRSAAGWVRGFAFSFMLPALAYFGLRWAYYGRLLPNSFYAKNEAGWNVSDQVATVLQFLQAYAAYPAVAAALALAAAATVRLRQPADAPVPKGRRLAPAVAYTLLLSAAWGVQYLRTDPVMNYRFRYYIPIYVLLLIVLAALFDRGWRALSRCTTRPRLVRSAVLCGCGGLLVWHARFLTQDLVPHLVFIVRNHHLIATEHAPAGRFLQQRLPADEWIAVHVDAGAIPYIADRRTLDLGKLNDEYLATSSRSAKEWADYFFACRPGALAMTSWDGRRIEPRFPGGAAILSDARFDDAYALVAEFASTDTPDYRQLIYLRRDLLRVGKPSEAAGPQRTVAIEEPATSLR